MFRAILVAAICILPAGRVAVADATAQETTAQKKQKKKARRVRPPTRNPHYQRHEFTGSRAKNGPKLVYYLMPPKDYDAKRKYPLVLALHGRGGNTTAAAVLGRDEMRKKYPCFVMAPMSPRPARWATPGSRKRTKRRPEKLGAVFDALAAVRKSYSIDATRIYVTGQSMGGFGSFGAVARRPDLFAAAVPICGGWSPDDAKAMAQVPLWIFHGADDNVVSVSNSRKMVKALKEAGGNPKYTEYPRVKHNSWTKAYETAELWVWMFAQRKPQPR